MIDKRIIGALIGLVGAVGNNGKTEKTDKVVIDALLAGDPEKAIEEAGEKADEEAIEEAGEKAIGEAIESIHREKYTISPDCAVCANPCGNTSDYDMSRCAQESAETKALKSQIDAELSRIIRQIGGSELRSEPLPEFVYRAIAYLGYDLQEEAYRKLLEEMKP